MNSIPAESDTITKTFGTRNALHLLALGLAFYMVWYAVKDIFFALKVADEPSLMHALTSDFTDRGLLLLIAFAVLIANVINFKNFWRKEVLERQWFWEMDLSNNMLQSRMESTAYVLKKGKEKSKTHTTRISQETDCSDLLTFELKISESSPQVHTKATIRALVPDGPLKDNQVYTRETTPGSIASYVALKMKDGRKKNLTGGSDALLSLLKQWQNSKEKA